MKYIKIAFSILLVFAVGITIGIFYTSKSLNNNQTDVGQKHNPESSANQSINLNQQAEHSHAIILEKIENESKARIILQQAILDIEAKLQNVSSNLQSETIPRETTASTAIDNSKSWFNQEAMATTGLSDSEILQIKNKYEKIEMDKLYLRDQAIRENWIGTERYRDAINGLDREFETLSNGVDDNVYETLLYATGQSNRVIIQDVLQNSPADQAGIKSGDFILQYGDKRVFSASDLRQAIASGNIGEEVKIKLDRNNTNIDVYLPRGPLGIRMESTSIKP